MKTLRKITLLLLSFALLALCCGCGNGNGESEKSASVVNYQIELKTEGGLLLSDVLVYVYESGNTENLVWAGETEEGKVSFEADEAKSYVAVLKGVPEGYKTSETYPLNSGATTLVFQTELAEVTDITSVSYKLGSVVGNFKIKSADGKEYEIASLLEEKKAVVLNFWFSNCEPCKMEFPFLQQAYEEYSDVVEVLALNPVDGTDESVASFAESRGLTFPMFACDAAWQDSFKLTAYPTTVVIDRYGVIAFVHKGSITEKEEFVKIFEFFTSDDYQQTVIKNISEIQ